LGSCAFRQWKAKSHCKFLHGYDLRAKIWIGCNELNSNGWVFDFGGFKDITDLLQHSFDHKTCVASDDPEFEDFVALNEKNVIQLIVFNDGVGIEKFAKAVFDLVNDEVKAVTKGRCWVEQVEVFEHDKNSAIYQSTVGITELVEPKQLQEQSEVSEHPGKQPKTEPEQPKPQDRVPIPAPVGQKSTSGKGNWFEGTSWG
jgi:6-pyruvoyltetrahydropterin/6-carboxytetrahydropterin synthase